jgi:hypothetical protein
MKATTMTLSKKSLSILPQDWCKREGLAQGGLVNVFDLGETGLLLRPLKPPSAAEVAKLLRQPPAGPHSPEEAAAIVERALRKVRRG